MGWQVRKLVVGDVAALRDLRLEALQTSVIQLGKMQVEQIQLTVVITNQRAVRFYEASGFRGYGIEKDALKSGESYFDELLMARFLT
jgi:RimJ/RimL family protein N-acetyltransferase